MSIVTESAGFRRHYDQSMKPAGVFSIKQKIATTVISLRHLQTAIILRFSAFNAVFENSLVYMATPIVPTILWGLGQKQTRLGQFFRIQNISCPCDCQFSTNLYQLPKVLRFIFTEKGTSSMHQSYVSLLKTVVTLKDYLGPCLFHLAWEIRHSCNGQTMRVSCVH